MPIPDHGGRHHDRRISVGGVQLLLRNRGSYRVEKEVPIRHQTLIRLFAVADVFVLPLLAAPASAQEISELPVTLPEAAGPGSALTVTAGDVEEGPPGIVREGASGTMASPFWSSGSRPSRAKGHPRHDRRPRRPRPDSRWKRLRVSATAIGWGKTIREFPADRGCRSGSEAVD